MKTKSVPHALFILIVSLLLALQYAYPQQKQQKQMKQMKSQLMMSKDEIPITSKSEEAKQKFLEGMELTGNSLLAKAKADFQDAIKLDPDFALGYYGLAITAGSFNKTKENIDKASDLMGNASEGEKHLISSLKYQVDGNIQKAKVEVDKLVNMFPKSIIAQMNAGNFEYFTNRNYDAAISHYQKVININKNYAPVYNLMGYVYSFKGDFSRAEKALKKYISLIPDNPNPYDSYAELLLKFGKYDQSIAQYNKALKIDPSFAYSLAGLGNNYIFKNDFAKARENYQALFEKAPDFNWKLNALELQAASFVREGDINNALTMLAKEAKMAESEGAINHFVNAENQQGLVLIESGKPEEAMKHFQTALDKIDGSNRPEQVKTNLATFTKLMQLYGMTAEGKLDEVKKELENKDKLIGKSTDPQVGQYYENNLGYLALKENKYDEAISHFLKGDQQNPVIWYFTALAYQKKGDDKKASQYISKIKKSNENSFALSVAHNNTKTAVAEEKK